MTRATARWAHVALGVVAWCGVASPARAHFPISRAVALTSGGSAAAVALPGFGIVLRRDAQQSFSYACNQLIGIPQSDTPAPMAFTEDGSLLIGTSSGLRGVTGDGCPRAAFGGALRSLPVVALAVSPGAANIVYAVTGGTAPRVARSTDGGQSWELRATLLTGDFPVAALVLEEGAPDNVYVSQWSSKGGSTLEASVDGGTSFSSLEQPTVTSLLQIEERGTGDGGARRFWAMGHDAARPTAFDILRAPGPEGPWTSDLTVNYFGGFALDPNGAVWIGDEGGGVYRSTNGGDSFDNVAPQMGPACLAFAQGSLFGCTPGIAQQPALVQWNDANQTFDDIVALSNVTQMVECDAPTNVKATCAAAWFEWQRDVVMRNLSGPDAGVKPAGAGGSPSAPVPVPATARSSSSGCSISGRRGAVNERTRNGSIASFALLWLARRKRRRGATTK